MVQCNIKTTTFAGGDAEAPIEWKKFPIETAIYHPTNLTLSDYLAYHISTYVDFSYQMKSLTKRKTEAQRRWRRKHPKKQKAWYKKYLPIASAKYVERYTYDDEFREKEKARQREYYAKKWKKNLTRIRERKMARAGIL